MAEPSLIDALNALFRRDSVLGSGAESSPSPPLFMPERFQMVVSAGHYVVQGARLRFRVASFTAGVAYTCSYRILLPNRQIVGFRQERVATGSYITDELTERLPECVILNAAIYTTASLYRGQAYGRIVLEGGYVTNSADIWTLAQGYLSSVFTVSWPDGPSDLAEQPPGYRVRIAGTSPAAGAEWFETQPYFGRARLLTIRFRFATSATVANRQVGFGMNSGGVNLKRWYYPDLQTASQSFLYLMQPQQPHGHTVGSTRMWWIDGDQWLGLNDTFGSVTTGLQAGDQYSDLSYYYELLHQF